MGEGEGEGEGGGAGNGEGAVVSDACQGSWLAPWSTRQQRCSTLAGRWSSLPRNTGRAGANPQHSPSRRAPWSPTACTTAGLSTRLHHRWLSTRALHVLADWRFAPTTAV